MPGTKKKSSKTQEKDKEPEHFPVVAIGASAGGLEALEAFFDNMPPESGTAFVIIQHIAPKGKSMLGDILQKHTRMKILDVRDGMRAEPNHVYLNPPGKDFVIFQSVFHLEDPVATHGPRLPIDHFFRSLALDRRERAICIILSGTGSDGTLGLKAIKEVGGLAMVQDVEQAKYGGMPASALATDLVDHVLPVEKMPGELVSYVKHPYMKVPKRIDGKDKQFTGYTQRVLALVRSATGNDFSGYKPKTIRRRIERRMALHKIEAVSDYCRFLQGNSNEVKLLFHELLIGVTQFFRDPYAFEALSEKVIPKILEQKKAGSPVRIWVPGCSTGEEALSLAMLFVEAMERRGERFELQIFATDLDAAAIDRARRAEYPEAITADVSEERLKRFFTKNDGMYKVKGEIRERIVYAPQNLVSDPPFSRLDLVSCRNVLIYMDVVLQKKIIPLLHFTLDQNGYLFLGSSEAVGGFSSLFSAVDSKWKIFKVKKDWARVRAPELPVGESPAEADFGRMKEKLERQSAQEAVDRLIVSQYAPATVLINDRYEALYLRGPTNRYLELPTGETSLNLLKIARPGLSFKLPPALHRATSERVQVTVSRVPVKQNGHVRTVDVTIRPLGDSESQPNLFVVVFEEVLPPEPVRRKQKKLSPGEETPPRVVELESELRTTRESLQATVEEFEAANEELKSSNEELQSTNEEIQSTNEELVTAREELQSTNEELVTINAELQDKVEELTRVNDDINNLFSSTEIGTIFLDNHLGIKRFTPAMKQLFNLIPSDVGRSLRDITSKIAFGSLFEDASSVLETFQRREKQVQTEEGRWFSMRILPYRTRGNQVDGVVATFADITEAKRIEREMRLARDYAEAIVNTVREPLLTLNAGLEVVSASQSFYRFFRTSPEETVGKRIYSLGNGQWELPDLRMLLEQIIPENTSFEDFAVEHDFPSVGRKKMLLNARRMEQEGGEPGFILLAMEDLTKD
jgi:two-component system, chemotaxis family, CheB/CheR fusion protein